MRALTYAALLAGAVLFAQDSGTVVGRVTDTATGFGIPGVAVELKNRNLSAYQATTDESGAFRMTGVKFGDYGGSTVEKAGYDRHEDPTMLGGSLVHVHGPDPVRWDIQMDPWTVLHGHVVYIDGKPAAKVRVQLGPRRDTQTSTDDNGTFAFQKLGPGSYTLWAKPDPKDQIQEGVRVEAVPTYFPSTVESSQAERIQVRGGIDLPDYEIRLQASPVYRVRGIVLNDLGKPARHASIKIMRRGGRGTQAYQFGCCPLSAVTGPAPAKEEAEVVSGEDGKFEFLSVQPGDWRVEAGADPVYDTYQDDYLVSSGGASALVTGHDIEDLEIRLAAPFKLEFSDDWGDASPPDSRGTVRPAFIPLDGQKQPGLLDPNAPFQVLPGWYRIVPPLFVDRSYVSSVLLGGREVLGQEVNLTPGLPPLRIVHKTSVGMVRGTVKNGEGSVVVWMSQEPGGVSFIRTLRCGADGTFDLKGFAPGDYYAAAFDRVDLAGMESAEFASYLRSNGALIRIDGGSAASVELHVTRWLW